MLIRKVAKENRKKARENNSTMKMEDGEKSYLISAL